MTPANPETFMVTLWAEMAHNYLNSQCPLLLQCLRILNSHRLLICDVWEDHRNEKPSRNLKSQISL